MSYIDAIRRGNERRKKWEEDNLGLTEIVSPTTGGSYAEAIRRGTERRRLWEEEQERVTHGLRDPFADDDIAPVKEEEEESNTWFKSSGLFDDGYDFGDITRTILGSGVDLVENVGAGLLGMGEKAVDAFAHLAPYAINSATTDIPGIYTEDMHRRNEQLIAEAKKSVDSFIQKDLYNEEKIAKAIITDNLKKVGVDGEAHSVFAQKSDSLAQSAGQLLGTIGLQAAHVPWWMTSGVMGYGSETENALKSGASHEEAGASALISAAAEIMTEKLFGGSGLGETGLINTSGLTRGISNKLVKTLADWGIDMASEGAEEVVSEIAGNLGSALYREESLKDILTSEEAIQGYIDSFIGGAALGGVMNTSKFVKSVRNKTDYNAGLTKNEQKVVDRVYADRLEEAQKNKEHGTVTLKEKNEIFDKVVRDMDKGYLSIDTIEETLGGDAFTEYRKTVEEEDAIRKEYEELGNKENPTLADRILDNTSKRDYLYKKLTESVQETVRGDRLIESYNERARVYEDFKADFDKFKGRKYEDAAKKTLESAVKAGANNTNRVRDLVEMAANLSGETGRVIEFKGGDQIKADFIERQTKEIAKMEAIPEGERTAEQSQMLADMKSLLEDVQSGKTTINGDITSDGIVLNLDSAKPLNRTIGHEITHSSENAKAYEGLRDSLFTYAKEKGIDVDGKLAELKAQYAGVPNANPEAELVADLVGDFLFTDADFANNLSIRNRNVFQKIYDEIKHLIKMATAGSKELRELERVKRNFEKALQEAEKAQTETDADTKYSIRKDVVDVNGKEYDSVVELDKTVSKSTLSNPKRFLEYIEKNLVGLQMAVEDASGNSEIIEFAKPNETTSKNGKRHPVLGELAYTRGDTRKQVIVNAEEVVGESQYDPVFSSTNNEHGWLDKNGWESRKTYVLTQDGMIYEAYLKIAKARDGRNILYAVNLDIKKGTAVDKGATSEKAAVLAAMPSANKVPQNGNGVKLSLSDDTADPDARFSLSEAVEETKDLLAVHNLHSAELLETLKLSGLPSPSVAIIKAQDGHEKYGDVSLILPKDAIDPQTNKANRIYGSDAWTPTRGNAQVEYEVDYAAQRQFERTVEQLAKNVAGGIFSKSSVLGMAGIEDSTSMNLKEIAEKISDYDAVRAAYIAENGGDVEVVYRTKVFDSYGNSALESYIGKVGEQEVARLAAKMLTGERLTSEEIETAKDSMMESWIEKHEYTLKQKPALRETRIAKFREKISDIRAEDFVRNAWEFYENVGARSDEIDYGATDGNLRAAADRSDVAAWVAENLQGLLSEPGIYNGKDPFTPSGKRRSFKEMHWEYTAENIVRAMNNADARGANVWNVSGEAIIATATPEYKSIDEVRADRGRLFNADKGDYEQIKDEISNELQQVTKDIIRTTDHQSDNQYDEEQIIGRVIMEAAQGARTLPGIKQAFRKNGYRIGDDQAKAVQALFDYASTVPTGYFEAKPQRVVGFDEVGVYVIPYDSDVKLKQELLNRGYSIAEYDPQVEGDRKRVVNQFEEYKFSLSDVGTHQQTYGNFDVYGSDFRVQKEIAPVAVSKTENTTPAQKTQLTAENSTVSKEEMVAMFPDEIAPDMELERLIQDKNRLESAMQEAFASGDDKALESIGTEYGEVMERISSLESEIAETEEGRLGSIQDADAPPEVEAPYYEEEAPVQPENPMADRNIDDVGNRKVKAYMFENPEVKPYFQAEARVMLGDLGESVRGEKLYNGQLYYESGGEKGWSGVRRQTTAEIADLLDNYGYTYAQIEKGLNAIIEDDGKENNAVSKRIEFALNDRLLNGYTNVWGEQMPPDQDYIRFLQEKEITEYSREAFESFMANADQYAPEDIAPVMAPAAVTAEESTAVEDIAPTYDVTGKKGVPDGQQAFLPDAGVEPKVTRKQLHQNIVDRVKDIFHVRGFEFDDVLKKAKDLSTFATVDNTPQRVMEKALGYKQGQILSDITVNKVAQNETEGIQWLNSFTDRKNGLLAQISKQYGIKPGSKQSAAAQMYAEGFYVGENDEIIAYTDKELAVDFPDPKVRANIKGLASDPRIRKIYDETLAAINESRTRNAYPEIPRLDNYFLHFRAMEDTFSRLGLPFNPNDIRAKDLPTDLNGVTADLKPGQPYFASAMHRTGKRTSFDLLGGLEKYLTSAKNQIYHIDDIQTLRALRNYVAEQYGQAQGLSNLNELSDEEAAQRIEAVYDSHLSTFAKFLNEEANVLAGKTALIDRGLEGIIGRRGITFLDTLNRQVGSNMVGYNISSSLTNFIAPVQALAKSNKADFLKGFAQTAANKVSSIFGRGDSFAEESPVMIRRKGAEAFYRTPWQKLSAPGYVLMSAVDSISTELIARAKYNEFTRQGMDSQTAHFETDKWVSRLMGDRSLGQQPQLYNSKMLGIITKFQLEVRNQLDSQFYDTIQEAKASTEDIENGLARNARKAVKVTSTFVQLAVLQHLFGKAFESVAGYNPAFDIISAIIKAFGWDDDEEDEDTVLDNIEEGFFELMGDMPYVSTMTGGRVPLESALPIQELYKGEDQYGNEKSRWETLAQAAPYWLLPGGYGQIKKTRQGLGMFDEDLPIAGSYTDSGKLRFPVEDTPINRLQAALFGQYASENARDYFDNERKALGENQIEEFLDSDLPIRDYWEYREGLSGLDKLSEKADYIDSLDLPISTKNLFINNIADRKERIDMTGYSNYSSFEEFDFAKKNPEKYSFLKENGVSVEQYNGFDEKTKDVYSWAFDNPERYQFLRSQGVTLHAYRDFDKETREAYGWAYENPDSISLAKTVGGIVEYNRIAAGWKDLDAKDEFGNSVSGLKKQRVYDYIYSLDIPEAEKHILFKSRYTSDDSHNYEIIDYLNSRADITYDEMIEILKKLKFEVDEEGNIYW